MLNPQWLRTFSTLVELGNFTRATERLEERLGPLLIRRPRQIELTPAVRAPTACPAAASPTRSA